MEQFTGTHEQFKKFEGKEVVLTHIFTEQITKVSRLSFEIYCQIGKYVLIEGYHLRDGRQSN